jgi:hypothetical protein
MHGKISASDFPQLLPYIFACHISLSLSLATQSSKANIEIFSRRLGQRIPDPDDQHTGIQNAISSQ